MITAFLPFLIFAIVPWIAIMIFYLEKPGGHSWKFAVFALFQILMIVMEIKVSV